MTSDDRALLYLAAANPIPHPEALDLPDLASAPSARRAHRPEPGMRAPRPPKPAWLRRPGWAFVTAVVGTTVAITGAAWYLAVSPEAPAGASTTVPPTSSLPVTTTAGSATTITPTTEVPPTTAATGPHPLRIVAIGDVLTAGTTAFSLGTSEATYRCFLDRLLTDAGVSHDFVGSQWQMAQGGVQYGCDQPFDWDHEGYDSALIDSLTLFLPERVARFEPDVALVMLGTYDLCGVPEPAAPEVVAASLEDFVAALQEHNPNMTILLAQIPPCLGAQWAGGVAVYDDLLSGVGNLSTETAPVVVVDLHTDFLDSWIVGSGCLCIPTDVGSEELARRWFAALQETGLIAPRGG